MKGVYARPDCAGLARCPQKCLERRGLTCGGRLLSRVCVYPDSHAETYPYEHEKAEHESQKRVDRRKLRLHASSIASLEPCLGLELGRRVGMPLFLCTIDRCLVLRLCLSGTTRLCIQSRQKHAQVDRTRV